MNLNLKESAMERDIYITDFDLKRLMELVQLGVTFNAKDGEYLTALKRTD